VRAEADEDVLFKYGIVQDASIGSDLRVTVIATGFNRAIKKLPVTTSAVGGKTEKEPEKDNLFTSGEWEKIIASTKPQRPVKAAGSSYGSYSPYGAAGAFSPYGASAKFDENDLDVPTVLREQRRFAAQAASQSAMPGDEPMRKYG
jgi:hypothetical protein